MRARDRIPRTFSRAAESLALLLALAACNEGGSPPRAESADTPAPTGASAGQGVEGISQALEVAASTRPNLQWKRHLAFEADLSRALELLPEELCTEFGRESCIRRVHLVPLGGHAPFETGLFESALEPLATTPTIVDRVVLSACSNRAELDKTLGLAGAKVFRQFDLAAPAPAPDSPAAQTLVTELYRRLLARDPDENERALVASMALDEGGQPLSALDFAKAACFVVGTTSEFLFF